MSGSFDPVSGKPTGSAPTARSRRGLSLPTGTVPGGRAAKPRGARRPEKRGGGTWVVVLGLVAGLGLIGVALIPRATNGSEAIAGPTTTTTTTTTAAPTTTTAAPTTTTTTTAPGTGWQTIAVTASGSSKVSYQVPPAWASINQFSLPHSSPDAKEYATLSSGAALLTTTCPTWPIAAGVYVDGSTGPTATLATKYAKGLATVVFSRPFERDATVAVASSRHLEGDGWIGRELVVHATEKATLDCGLHQGVVAVLAIATDDAPDRTIMIAAFSGTDSPDGVDEPTLRKIVESVRVGS